MSTLSLPAFLGLGLWLPEKTKNPVPALKAAGFQSVLTLGDHPESECVQNASYCLDDQGSITKFANIGNPFIYAPNLLSAPDSYVLYQLMLRARQHDMTYLSSPIDQSLSIDGEMHEGEVSFRMGLRGIPSLAEEVIVGRDIELARKTKCQLHFLAISSARSVALIEEAKNSGVRVTAGVKLENLVYTQQACEGFNNDYKFFPPLRADRDREALREGAKTGVIDIISLGFHPQENLDCNFTQAAFTSLPFTKYLQVLVEELLNPGIFTIEQISALLSTNPAKILNYKQSLKQLEINLETFEVSFKET